MKCLRQWIKICETPKGELFKWCRCCGTLRTTNTITNRVRYRSPEPQKDAEPCPSK